MAKRELLATIQDRYRASSKRDKSRILDEFIAVTGHHRKHGIRLPAGSVHSGARAGAVREVAILVWQASDLAATTEERDYNASGRTLTFNPGITERTITVTVLVDATVAYIERFRVELFEPTNAVLGKNSLTWVTILDHDESEPYRIIAPATVNENYGSFRVTVEDRGYTTGGTRLQPHRGRLPAGYSHRGSGLPRHIGKP